MLFMNTARPPIVKSPPKPGTRVLPQQKDRRLGDDRRLVDVDRPGERDRRRGLEPRMPEVIELEMSHSEWGALSELPPTPSK